MLQRTTLRAAKRFASAPQFKQTRGISAITRAAAFGVTRLVYLRARIAEEMRAEVKSIPEREERRTPFITPKMAETREQMKEVIQAGMRQAGYDGNIIIEIDLPDDKPLNAQVCAYINEQGEKSAYVQITSYAKEIKNPREFFNELFAIAGHEGVHARDNHQYKDALTYAAMGYFLPLIILKNMIRGGVSKVTEFIADFDSARLLGTGNVLIESQQRNIAYENSPEAALEKSKKLSDPLNEPNGHPSYDMRKKCIQLSICFFGAKDVSPEVEEVLKKREEAASKVKIEVVESNDDSSPSSTLKK